MGCLLPLHAETSRFEPLNALHVCSCMLMSRYGIGQLSGWRKRCLETSPVGANGASIQWGRRIRTLLVIYSRKLANGASVASVPYMLTPALSK